MTCICYSVESYVSITPFIIIIIIIISSSSSILLFIGFLDKI